MQTGAGVSSKEVFPLLLLIGFNLTAADWPRFRGPNGSGVGEEANLPAEFGPERNVAWKVAVPFGRSSPVVVAGRIFLTANEGENLLTLAYDAATGRPLWRRELKRPRTQTVFRANDPASSTPAADARGVYVFFPDFGLISYSHEGEERWRHPLGPFENFYGMSTAPVVDGGLLLLLCDQARGSYLLALDKDSGRARWKRDRPASGEGWSVPIVQGDQVIAIGSTRIDSYHLSTGEPRWWIAHASQGSMGSPVVHNGSVLVTTSGSDQPWMPSFAASLAKLDKDGDKRISLAEFKEDKDWFEHFGWMDSNHDKLLDAAEWEAARSMGLGDYGAVSIPLDGKGQLPKSAVKWRVKRSLPYVPSPLLYGGVFYMVKDGGIVTSLDPATGAVLKQGRAAPGEYFASPVAADGKIYLASVEGKITTLKAGAQWQPLGTGDLGEECYATPAISGDRLFVRTRGTLYAFRNKP